MAAQTMYVFISSRPWIGLPSSTPLLIRLRSIVTGAGGGIGLAIVQQLLDQTDAGTLVVGVDIVGHRLEKLQLSAPEKLEIIIGDVAQRSTSEKAVQVALDRTGRIDTLILNAGILRPVGAIATTPVEQWKSLFDVNFFSLLHTVSEREQSRGGPVTINP